jgi:hypothetical protein
MLKFQQVEISLVSCLSHSSWLYHLGILLFLICKNSFWKLCHRINYWVESRTRSFSLRCFHDKMERFRHSTDRHTLRTSSDCTFLHLIHRETLFLTLFLTCYIFTEYLRRTQPASYFLLNANLSPHDLLLSVEPNC